MANAKSASVASFTHLHFLSVYKLLTIRMDATIAQGQPGQWWGAGGMPLVSVSFNHVRLNVVQNACSIVSSYC